MALDDPIVFLLIIVLVLVALYLYIRSIRSNRRKATESVIVSIVRARNGATLDDVIIGAHISSKDAGRFVQDLMSKNVIKMQEKDGKTVYVSA